MANIDLSVNYTFDLQLVFPYVQIKTRIHGSRFSLQFELPPITVVEVRAPKTAALLIEGGVKPTLVSRVPIEPAQGAAKLGHGCVDFIYLLRKLMPQQVMHTLELVAQEFGDVFLYWFVLFLFALHSSIGSGSFSSWHLIF